MSETEESISFFDPQHPLAHIGKKIFLALSILITVVLYYLLRYSKGTQVIATLLKIAPAMLVGMVIMEMLYLIAQGGLLKQVYQTVGFERSITYLTGMYIAMNLVNTVAPVIGLSGSIYMMHFEKNRGINRSDTFLINFLYYLTDYLVFLAVLVAGLIYLLVIGQITRTVIITSLVFACFVIALSIVGLVIFSHPTALHRTIHWLNRTVTKLTFRRRPLFKDSHIQTFASGATEAWERSRGSVGHLFGAALYALTLHISCLAMLWLGFAAFGVATNLQTIIAGYTVATLLNIVSITPGGIGFAEGGMTAVFVALGLPVEQALSVTLLYRVLFTWLPLGLGLIVIHILPEIASQEAAGSL